MGKMIQLIEPSKYMESLQLHYGVVGDNAIFLGRGLAKELSKVSGSQGHFSPYLGMKISEFLSFKDRVRMRSVSRTCLVDAVTDVLGEGLLKQAREIDSYISENVEILRGDAPAVYASRLAELHKMVGHYLQDATEYFLAKKGWEIGNKVCVNLKDNLYEFILAHTLQPQQKSKVQLARLLAHRNIHGVEDGSNIYKQNR